MVQTLDRRIDTLKYPRNVTQNAMIQPDGMGADMYRERQNMIESRHDEPDATHDVIAVDSDGNKLYDAEAAWSEEAAESEKEACDALLESKNSAFPSEVDHFEVRERNL